MSDTTYIVCTPKPVAVPEICLIQSAYVLLSHGGDLIWAKIAGSHSVKTLVYSAINQ